jgi:hypothetical protein
VIALACRSCHRAPTRTERAEIAANLLRNGMSQDEIVHWTCRGCFKRYGALAPTPSLASYGPRTFGRIWGRMLRRARTAASHLRLVR